MENNKNIETISMDYITQHHHILRNSPFSELSGLTVLLVEPEAEARIFYSQQLENIDMRVIPLDSISMMPDQIRSVEPSVIIVNPSADIKAGINFFKTFRREFPDLPIITMALTMPDDTLDAIMKAGVSFHINRALTRPRDLLLALEQVISMK